MIGSSVAIGGVLLYGQVRDCVSVWLRVCPCLRVSGRGRKQKTRRGENENGSEARVFE